PLSPSFYILLHSSFFFNDPATPAFSTLSLHDALPISRSAPRHRLGVPVCAERSNFEAVVACSATGGRSWCARTGILSHPWHSGSSSSVRIEADGRASVLGGCKYNECHRFGNSVGRNRHAA